MHYGTHGSTATTTFVLEPELTLPPLSSKVDGRMAATEAIGLGFSFTQQGATVGILIAWAVSKIFFLSVCTSQSQSTSLNHYLGMFFLFLLWVLAICCVLMGC